MFELFKQDVARWIVPESISPVEDVTPLVMLKLTYRQMSLRAMAWFRFGSWCRRKRIPLMTGIIGRLIYRRYGLEIKIGADIDGGLYIAHPIGCVVAPRRMGKNCTIIAATTIGTRGQWASKLSYPDIGNNVFVGAGARILGGITVGDDARIGANAVVIHDVPASATAVGIPARVKRLNGVPLTDVVMQ